jgi:hypothetical protein
VGVDWYVFGAQAALIHGAARVTADVDVTVRLGAVTTTRLAGSLERHGFSLRVQDPAFVRTTRVLPILHVRSSVPADLVIAGPGLEDAFLERAEIRKLAGVRVPVARVEDLLVMKILAGRDKDLEDVAAIIAARGDTLDAKDVSRLLTMIEDALGQSDLLPAWRRLRVENRKPATKPHSATSKKAVSARVRSTLPIEKRGKLPVEKRGKRKA